LRARKAAAAAGTIPPLLDRNWLEQLYVDPDLTGQGVGSTLLALAKRERPDGLRLWTFVSNLGARRFYLRHGFREVERTDGARNWAASRTRTLVIVWATRRPAIGRAVRSCVRAPSRLR
jgi:predicted N-acetyltransferase YhbS